MQGKSSSQREYGEGSAALTRKWLLAPPLPCAAHRHTWKVCGGAGTWMPGHLQQQPTCGAWQQARLLLRHCLRQRSWRVACCVLPMLLACPPGPGASGAPMHRASHCAPPLAVPGRWKEGRSGWLPTCACGCLLPAFRAVGRRQSAGRAAPAALASHEMQPAPLPQQRVPQWVAAAGTAPRCWRHDPAAAAAGGAPGP